MEDDGRIGAEHSATAYLRGERVANLASGAVIITVTGDTMWRWCDRLWYPSSRRFVS